MGGADQEARTRTYDPGQQFTSDILFQVPPDPMYGQQAAEGAWEGVEAFAGGGVSTERHSRIFVLGGCATCLGLRPKGCSGPPL